VGEPGRREVEHCRDEMKLGARDPIQAVIALYEPGVIEPDASDDLRRRVRVGVSP
jgi:hypothetical protein